MRCGRSTGTKWETGRRRSCGKNEVRTEIVTTGQRKVRSYDLDGQLLWELEGMTINTVPTPFAMDGLIYISSGWPGANPRPVYAIRPGASGDISLWAGESNNDYIVWYQPRLGTYSTSALVYRGTYYTLLDRGFLLSHNARTGAEIYGRQRVQPGIGFTASPWAYNGKIFLMSEDGDTYVVEAGPEFKIVGKNSRDEMRCRWRRRQSFEEASSSGQSRSTTGLASTDEPS